MNNTMNPTSEHDSTSVSSEAINHTHTNNNHNHPIRPNNETKIVRSIASYLSLSDVESIGSLYSLMSFSAKSSTPYYASSSSRNYNHHSLGRPGSTPRLHPKKFSLNNNSVNRLPVIGANFYNEEEEEDTYNTVNDDDHEDNHINGDKSQKQESINQDNDDQEEFSIIDSIDLDLSNHVIHKPELIPISPDSIGLDLNDDNHNDDDYDDDDSYTYPPNNRNNNSHEFYTTTQTQQQQHEYLKFVQEKLKSAVFAHPYSIRSYCVSSKVAADEMRRKRQISSTTNVVNTTATCITTFKCPICNRKSIYKDDYSSSSSSQLFEKKTRSKSGNNCDEDESSFDFQHLEEEDNIHDIDNDDGISITSLSSSSQPRNHKTRDKNDATNTQRFQCICQLYIDAHTSHSSSIRIPQPPPPSIPIRILQILSAPIFQNIPLSILFDLSIHLFSLTSNTTQATFYLSLQSIHSIVHSISYSILQICSHLSKHLNPFSLIDTILNLHKHSEGIVIISGLQSVSGNSVMGGGVGGDGSGGGVTSSSQQFLPQQSSMQYSSSQNAMHTIMNGIKSTASSTRSGLWSGVPASLSLGKINLLRGNNNGINEKMFRKLRKIDSTAKVISYVEREDEAITHHYKKRVQRMMHYPVSLRPFVATIELSTSKSNLPPLPPQQLAKKQPRTESFQNVDFLDTKYSNGSPSHGDTYAGQSNNDPDATKIGEEDTTIHSLSEDSSPFMCTPKSFPPTPSSRAHVIARGTRFAEDVVFLARDQLRVEGGLDSKNAQTRAMAKALLEGKHLAVFNASDVGGGIILSCGQHCATKIGNDLYCTARGMIPILRNCCVYFEMSVSTPALLSMMLHHASLSVGLSTLEMPLNALVGAWKGSVGLCSTGQILVGSQWCSPIEHKTYGSNSTVGCLVYLDDHSAFDTWDGVMVRAHVVFNINGSIVTPSGLYDTNSTMGEESMSPFNTNGDSSSQHPIPLPVFVARDEELFPTLTLHSSQTEVMCRFCAEDIICKSRSEIGAPNGVVVYAVDGSVLFDEETEDFYPNDDGILCQDDDDVISCSSLQV